MSPFLPLVGGRTACLSMRNEDMQFEEGRGRAWHCRLQGRVRTLALSESSREDVISSVKDFLNPKAYYQVTCLMGPHRWASR